MHLLIATAATKCMPLVDVYGNDHLRSTCQNLPFTGLDVVLTAAAGVMLFSIGWATRRLAKAR